MDKTRRKGGGEIPNGGGREKVVDQVFVERSCLKGSSEETQVKPREIVVGIIMEEVTEF